MGYETASWSSVPTVRKEAEDPPLADDFVANSAVQANNDSVWAGTARLASILKSMMEGSLFHQSGNHRRPTTCQSRSRAQTLAKANPAPTSAPAKTSLG